MIFGNQYSVFGLKTSVSQSVYFLLITFSFTLALNKKRTPVFNTSILKLCLWARHKSEGGIRPPITQPRSQELRGKREGDVAIGMLFASNPDAKGEGPRG